MRLIVLWGLAAFAAQRQWCQCEMCTVAANDVRNTFETVNHGSLHCVRLCLMRTVLRQYHALNVSTLAVDGTARAVPIAARATSCVTGRLLVTKHCPIHMRHRLLGTPPRFASAKQIGITFLVTAIAQQVETRLTRVSQTRRPNSSVLCCMSGDSFVSPCPNALVSCYPISFGLFSSSCTSSRFFFCLFSCSRPSLLFSDSFFTFALSLSFPPSVPLRSFSPSVLLFFLFLTGSFLSRSLSVFLFCFSFCGSFSF